MKLPWFKYKRNGRLLLFSKNRTIKYIVCQCWLKKYSLVFCVNNLIGYDIFYSFNASIGKCCYLWSTFDVAIMYLADPARCRCVHVQDALVGRFSKNALKVVYISFLRYPAKTENCWIGFEPATFMSIFFFFFFRFIPFEILLPQKNH